MTMEFDCGNSVAKWRLTSQSIIVARGVFLYGGSFSEVFNRLPVSLDSLVGCRVASVAQPSVRLDLERSWQEFSDAPIKFASVEQECAGVRCGYEDTAQMGIDRWSATVAASQIVEGPCVVVDAGTAITIDILNAKHQHQGGYILPGMELMLASLQDKTAISKERIPEVEMLGNLHPGQTTSSAIANAVSLACAGFVTRAAGTAENGAQIVLTGGQSSVLKEIVPSPVTIVPDLVLDGLALLLPMGPDQ